MDYEQADTSDMRMQNIQAFLAIYEFTYNAYHNSYTYDVDTYTRQLHEMQTARRVLLTFIENQLS